MPDFPTEILKTPEAAEAVRIITELKNAGFVAVLAGGCVRDALLGRKPKDFDVATDATPESVREVFGKRSTLAFGESFGVIGVLPPRSASAQGPSSKRMPTEVATFRADGNYSDGRRPDSVTYGDAEADALRRDFTINGMFYDVFESRVIDYVGGIEDLSKGHLRTIGKATQRFEEDKLRMLRAVRFATTLRFSIEHKTFAAIQNHASDISVVSGERIGAEMRRLMTAAAVDFGLETLVDTGLSLHIWPQLQTMNWTEFSRAIQAAKHPTFETAMAIALFHLPGDSMHTLRLIFDDWKLSVAERRAIEAALTHAETITQCDGLAWSRLQPILVDADASTIVATARALAPKSRGVARAGRALSGDPLELDPPPLVTGADLIAIGMRPGPEFKAILQSIRDDQLDGKLNSREEALKRIPPSDD